MRIIAEETMAIVIDFQERLVPVMEKKDEILSNTEILIQGLNVLKVPIVVTQQYTKGLGMTVDSIKNVIGEEFKYYDKTSFSCYDDDVIVEVIKKYNKKNIIICGIEAHVCVLQTVVDCIAAGYEVILVEDCISSRKTNDKQVGIKRAVNEGAKLTTYESILFELTRKAGSDTFKTISKLIK
jgi:nicotinamidase-related amidase